MVYDQTIIFQELPGLFTELLQYTNFVQQDKSLNYDALAESV